MAFWWSDLVLAEAVILCILMAGLVVGIYILFQMQKKVRDGRLRGAVWGTTPRCAGHVSSAHTTNMCLVVTEKSRVANEDALNMKSKMSMCSRNSRINGL